MQWHSNGSTGTWEKQGVGKRGPGHARSAYRRANMGGGAHEGQRTERVG